MQLSLQAVLAPCSEDNLIGVQVWCKEYERFNKYPVDIPTRFNIGVYQIHQGMDWEDRGLNKYESFCAAFLHFVMVAERSGLDIAEPLIPITFKFVNGHKKFIKDEAYNLLRLISICTQELYYYHTKNKLRRKSRYNEDRLKTHLMFLCNTMICIVPPELRCDGVYTASKIMLGLL